MRAMSRNGALPIVVALALGLAGAGAAADLGKLPPDAVLPRGEGSPGQVTFRHASHVDPASPSCVSCHPRQFRILERAATASGAPIRHAEMEKGALCGSCHGKAAFGFDRCELCHE